jgi:hypothetical protein
MKLRFYSQLLLAVMALSLSVSARAVDDVVPLEEESPDPKLAKIVIVAGQQAGNIEHQYWAGSVAIMKLLKQTPGLHISMVRGGWPKNPAIFDNAKCIVLNLEGGEGGFIHPLTEGDNFAVLQKHMEKGVGLATFHKAVALPPELGTKMAQWSGAFYDFKAGNKGHWLVSFSTFVDHPSTRGMKPFALNDGYVVGLTFNPDQKGLTPLLFAPKGKGKEGIAAETSKELKDVTAWAYERADGARAFNFSGLHSHKYFKEESIRKFVANGILWAAKIDVPAEGAKVDFDPEDLQKNLEPINKPPAKK